MRRHGINDLYSMAEYEELCRYLREHGDDADFEFNEGSLLEILASAYAFGKDAYEAATKWIIPITREAFRAGSAEYDRIRMEGTLDNQMHGLLGDQPLETVTSLVVFDASMYHTGEENCDSHESTVHP